MFKVARSQVLLLSLAGFLSLGATSAYANVFQDDARITATPDQYPNQAVGILQFSDGGWCTASLVSRDMILTAAHCVFDPKTGFPIPNSDMTFYPNVHESHWQHSSSVQLTSWGASVALNGRNGKNDWAFLKLDAPLGNIYGWFRLSPVNILDVYNQGRYALVGYSRDWNHGNSASFENHCKFSGEFVEGVFEHNCDLWDGASGAPMFYVGSDGAAYIVAIVTGGITNPDGSELPSGIPYTPDAANLAVPASTFSDVFERIK